MISKEAFNELSVQNRNVQNRASQLNVRAGAVLFVVLTAAQIKEFLLHRMKGARNMQEISNLEALRFSLRAVDSAADPEALAFRVTAENPDQIEVLGLPRRVEYRDGFAPRIRLDRSVLGGAFLSIPESGVRLPNGRAVEVAVQTDTWSTISGIDISELKGKLRNHLKDQAWNAWTTRPAIMLPDPAEESPVPELLEAVYGQCVGSSTPLVAYGAVAVNDRRYYSSDPWFKGQWYQNRLDAEVARDKAVDKLEEARKEFSEAKELESAKKEAQHLRERITALYEQRTVQGNLSDRLHNRQYSSIPSDVSGARQWSRESQELIVEVESLMAAEARKTEQAALRDWGGHFRRIGGSGNADFWVVQPNGTLREADRIAYRKHYRSEGNKMWKIVEQQELALEWHGGTSFTIANRPTTLTPAQLDAVRRIETEDLYLEEGFFGLDVEAKQRQAATETATEKALSCCCPACGGAVSLKGKYLQLVSNDGSPICQGSAVLRIANFSKLTENCCGRDAQLVSSIPTEFGMLEVLAFGKFGTHILNVRLRPFREGEGPAVSDHRKVPAPERVDQAALQALFDRFGGKKKGSGTRSNFR